MKDLKCKNHYPTCNWDVIDRSKSRILFKCPKCGEEAEYKLAYGEGVDLISGTYEKRLEAARPLVQPFRDGVPSAEYVKLTGGKNMSKEDQRRAVKVWGDVPGLKGVC